MVLLVPELTFLTGLSDLRKNSRILKEVMWEMIQSPQQHYQRLTSLLCRIRDTPEASQELERWGLCLDTDIYRTQGHILPVERINLRHRSFLPAEDLSWHREVTKEVPITVISISSWLMIYPKRLQHLAKDLVAAMRSSCGAMGMQVGHPTVQELRDDRIETYVRTIQSSLGSQDKVQLLLCIIPSSREDIYGAIKKLCCVQTPVPSQVINAQSLTGHPGKIRNVVQKVLLQINCKLGGQLWGVDIPLVRHENPGKRPGMSLEALEKQLRIVGIDVIPKSHLPFPAPLSQNPTSFPPFWDELTIVGIDILIKSHLPFPAPLSLNPSSFPPLQKQLMVVGMDIYHSRSQGMRSSGVQGSLRCKNVYFGVGKKSDWGLFFPPRQDFFLLAHHSRQGCSVPTRYICMWNTANLSSEHLQRLTFKLCHLYWNWPGTIRVPAPCKYAHKLAFLVGQVLHHEPSAHFSEQLFFL
ncbi:PIWL2 protein, partial [Cinclus mexicanus]|nr:PIWL2 protein [Cinclus mexicanus]